MPFELIRSEILVQGRAFNVKRDTLRTPDGRETKLEIVEHGGSVVLLPIDEEGNLLFVRQYRAAVGEGPGGLADFCAAVAARHGDVPL